MYLLPEVMECEHFFYHLLYAACMIWFAISQLESYLLPHVIGIANLAKRERNKGAKQLDALMKVEIFNFYALVLKVVLITLLFFSLWFLFVDIYSFGFKFIFLPRNWLFL